MVPAFFDNIQTWKLVPRSLTSSGLEEAIWFSGFLVKVPGRVKPGVSVPTELCFTPTSITLGSGAGVDSV